MEYRVDLVNVNTAEWYAVYLPRRYWEVDFEWRSKTVLVIKDPGATAADPGIVLRRSVQFGRSDVRFEFDPPHVADFR